MIERCAFVAITSRDLVAARRFWVDQFGFALTEQGDEYFIVDAGGLRLCIDREDGNAHRASGGAEPVLSFKVASLDATLHALAARGATGASAPTPRRGGHYATLRDPDGHLLVLTETD